LKTRVVFLKNVAAGTRISYGGTFRARRPSRIATLPIGYADGLPRLLSNAGEVLLRGRRCPIVGTVTMDMIMVDATDAPEARVGDEAVLIGRQGALSIGAAEVAERSRTISYEVVTGLQARVPRVYIDR